VSSGAVSGTASGESAIGPAAIRLPCSILSPAWTLL
jgi:hypothetical protein